MIMNPTVSPGSIDAQRHTRYVRNETLIAMLINSLLSAIFTLLVFGRREAIALWDVDGLALDFVPQTFLITLMTVVAATLLTRKRVHQQTIERLSGPPPRLPSNALLRALLFAITATVVFGGLATGVLALVWNGSASFAAIIIPKIFYGALIAALVAPIALRAALRDVPPVEAPSDPAIR